jgi:hypothetical protein
MITRAEEIQCFMAAIEHCTNKTGDHETSVAENAIMV